MTVIGQNKPFRFEAEQIASAYENLEEAYTAGDFCLVAASADRGSELWARAMVLAGFVDHGLRALAAREALSSEGEFVRAYAEWVVGEDDSALARLRQLTAINNGDLAAKLLLKWIQQPEIRVFATAVTLPITTGGADHRGRASYHCGKFHVLHVGTQLEKNAYAYRPTEDFTAFVQSLPDSEQPDLIYAQTPQWFAPRNLASVNVPKVCWAHDTDFFLYRNPEYLKCFNTVLVSISQEHYELRNALGVNCVSNHFADSLQTEWPKLREPRSKDFDIVFTGGSVSSDMTDRSRVFFELSRLSSRYRILVVDGHLQEDRYIELLSRGKFTIVVNRYLGCPSPRWRDALNIGTAVLYPQGSTYAAVEHGCYPFSTARFIDDIAAHLDSASCLDAKDESQLLARHSALGEFLAPFRIPQMDLQERHLKLCLMSSALAARGDHRSWRQKAEWRAVWPFPTMDAWMFGAGVVNSKVETFCHDLGRPDAEADAIEINNTAMLHIQLAWLGRRDDNISFVEHFHEALAIVADGITQHPRSMLLRFNYAHWQMTLSVLSAADRMEIWLHLIDDLDRLELDIVGADWGLGMTGLGVDKELPYYELGSKVMVFAVEEGLASPAAETTADCIRRMLACAAHGYAAKLAAEIGDVGTAIDILRKGIALDPTNWNMMVLLDRMLDDVLKSGMLHEEQCRAPRAERLALKLDALGINPRLLLLQPLEILHSCVDAGRTELVDGLVDRWVCFRRMLAFPDEIKYFPSSTTELSQLSPYLEYCSERTRARVADWPVEADGGWNRENDGTAR